MGAWILGKKITFGMFVKGIGNRLRWIMAKAVTAAVSQFRKAGE